MTKQEILEALWYMEREITVDGETLTVLTPLVIKKKGGK